MKKKKIAVLMGGWSAERDVSLASGQSVMTALTELGHEAIPVDVLRGGESLLSLKDKGVEIAFNALHGTGGEDGVVQGFLETLKIPYTHSGVMASSLAMNKIISRHLFKMADLPTPQWKVITLEEYSKGHPMDFPYVVKPTADGSSRGVYIIFKDEDRPDLSNWGFGDQVLVERYIPGREIQVAVMGDKAIGAIEIRPKEGFYDFAAKYTPGLADHLMPAPIPANDYKKIMDYAERAHRLLGCRGVTRTDFLYTEEDGQAYILEVNTQPGMTPLSLVQEIAAHQGITFNQLIQWMVDQAQCEA